jgi:hypothetical protein
MRKATTAALLLLLAFPLQAVAASVAAPPGNSEADQYFETLPTPGGARSPDPTKTAKDAVEEGKLTPAASQELQKRGPDGQGVAGIVAQTAPPGAARKDDHGSANGPLLKGVGVGAPDEQGMGAFFPLILAATAVAALAFAVDRHRRSSTR